MQIVKAVILAPFLRGLSGVFDLGPVHTSLEKFKNATIADRFRFVF